MSRRRRQREAEEAVAYVLHTARSWAQLRAVSYTHLTLPTIYSV